LFPPQFLAKPFTYLDAIIEKLLPFRIPNQATDLDVTKRPRSWIATAKTQFEEASAQAELSSQHHVSGEALKPPEITAIFMSGEYQELISKAKEILDSLGKNPSARGVLASAYVAE
jgi:hypothetical protein